MNRILAVVMVLSLCLVGLLGGASASEYAPRDYSEWSKTSFTTSTDDEINVQYYGDPIILADGGHTLGISVSMSTDYFQTVTDSFTERAEADGNTVIVVGAERDAAKQISDVEDLITAGCDAIAICAVDRDAITPALKAIQEAGIYCISFDASPAEQTYTQGFVGTDNFAAGAEGGKQMLKDYPDGGKVGVLCDLRSSAGMFRGEGFLDAIKDSNLEVVVSLDAEGEQQKGLDYTNDIIEAHGEELVAIWGVNDQCIMGAYAACTTAGADIGLYGVDGTPESKGYIAEDGIFKMTAGQSPITIGVQMYAYLESLMAQYDLGYNRVDIAVIVMTPETVAPYLESDWQ